MPDDAALARAKNIIEIWVRGYGLRWDGTPTWSDLELLADALATVLRAYGDARARQQAEEDAKIVDQRQRNHHGACVCDLCFIAVALRALAREP